MLWGRLIGHGSRACRFADAELLRRRAWRLRRKSGLLGGIVQFCALAISAPEAHFWTNEANKWFVFIVSKKRRGQSFRTGGTWVMRILGWGVVAKLGEIGGRCGRKS